MNCWRKLISFVAVAAIGIGGASAASATDEQPQVKQMYFQENFANNQLSTTWVFDQTGGSISVEDQALKIKRTQSEGTETIADLYMNANKSVYRGNLGLEFTITKSASKLMYFRIRGTGDYFAADWREGGTLAVYYSDDRQQSAAIKAVTNVQSLQARFKILFNTEASTFTLWLNDTMLLKDVYARALGNGVQYARMYLQGSQLMTASVTDIRFYEAYPLASSLAELDVRALNWGKISSEPENEAGIITENLTLPPSGGNGSSIVWSSSDETVLSSAGIVRRQAVDRTVVLTATARYGGYSAIKKFTFLIPKQLQSDAEVVAEDRNRLTYSDLSVLENGASQIMRSLTLPERGIYGSGITWQTSDPSHITASGRVQRPKCGEADANVTMTATFTKGSQSVAKAYSFTVLADQPFADPQHMSDQDFFGEWQASSATWSKEGKLNYTFAGLQQVEQAVKQNDYQTAKQRLTEYFQTRKPGASTSAGRNTGWVNMILDDFYHLQGSEYYQGEITIGKDWGTYNTPISAAYIQPGATVSFSVRSWYNEAGSAVIASKEYAGSGTAPRIEMTVNGAARSFPAIADTYVRAGKYSKVNYGVEDTLKVRTYGDFLGDETYHAELKFDFTSLKATDKIQNAKLVLYGKTSPGMAGGKRLILIKEPTNTWEEQSAVWGTFPGYVYSFNGLPGKNTWSQPSGADAEYFWQMARFGAWGAIAREYQVTRDETVAYKAQRIVEDYLTDTGGYRSTGTGYGNNANGIRGGFPRSLDAASKNNSFAQVFDILIKSDSVTPDYCTALLKNIWDTANYLTVYHSSSGNWRQHEYNSVKLSAQYFPEFTDANAGNNWTEKAQTVLEELIFANNFSDGSYIEATGGYNVGAFNMFRNYKADVIKTGGSVSQAYDDMLHKSAYYNALLFASDGSSIQYGDEMPSTRGAGTFQDICNWYGDKELEYIITYGASGTKPDWTSKQWPKSAVTVMRADWTKDSPYLFTNVRGGGQHSHADDNGVVVYSNGRVLLNDAGIFTYTSSDPYRIWARSSTAHNTVVMNEKTQNTNGSVGTIHEFRTNDAFDFLSQSTAQNPGFTHRRTITFIKPGMWIVSDQMTPEDLAKANDYQQIWHMLPGAGLQVSQQNQTISSNYAQGANIVVASADGSAVQTEQKMGWYDRSYQQLEEAPYGYFSKKGAVGKTTFDTVLLPTQNDPDASVTARKLPTTAGSTAMEIQVDADGKQYTGAYYMSPEGTGGSFGEFQTDAGMAYVQKNAQGAVEYLQLKGGKYIRNTQTGQDLYRSKSQTGELAITFSDNNVMITTDGETDIASAVIRYAGQIGNVLLNGDNAYYTYENGQLSGIRVNDLSRAASAITLSLINRGNDRATVYQDLYLPQAIEGCPGVSVAWNSDKPEIAVQGQWGRVTLYEDQATEVCLTATVSDQTDSFTKTFLLELPYDETPACAENGQKFNEDFAGKSQLSQINGELVQNGKGGGTVSLAGERLKMVRTSTSTASGDHDGFNYYFNKNHAGITGNKVTLEFEIERENLGEIYLISKSGNGGSLTNLSLNIGGSDGVSCWTDSATNAGLKDGYTDVGPTKIIMEHDFQTRTYSLWVGGEKLAENKSFRSAGGSDLAYLYVYMQNTFANTAYFDNFKVYQSAPRSKTAVDRDAAALESLGFAAVSAEAAGAVTQPFSYQTAWGSSVCFSDSSGLVQQDGSFTRPDTDRNTELTVAVSKGAYERSFQFPAVLLGRISAGEFEFENQAPVEGDNNVKIQLQSQSGNPEKLLLVVAAYENGRLENVAFQPCMALPAKAYASASVYLDRITMQTVVKAFLLDGLDSLRPLK